MITLSVNTTVTTSPLLLYLTRLLRQRIGDSCTWHVLVDSLVEDDQRKYCCCFNMLRLERIVFPQYHDWLLQTWWKCFLSVCVFFLRSKFHPKDTHLHTTSLLHFPPSQGHTPSYAFLRLACLPSFPPSTRPKQHWDTRPLFVDPFWPTDWSHAPVSTDQPLLPCLLVSLWRFTYTLQSLHILRSFPTPVVISLFILSFLPLHFLFPFLSLSQIFCFTKLFYPSIMLSIH